jgi:NAD(P)-dependent dehydrogenase (short-subunit alcohol dehydrogenase family)
MPNLNHPVVLVTGAAGNLGRAVAAAFAAHADGLALVDLHEPSLSEACDALAGNTNCLGLAADLLDPAAVNHVIDKARGHFGRIDVVANIAGGFRMGPPVHETPDADWDFMMDLNARSVFNMCRATVPVLLANGGGRIINVSARAAREGKAGMGPYCASKAAVITLTESLAAENRHEGLNVNCILPGTIDTPQNRADMPDADHSRWVPPSALADVVVFLASDAARCVTGAAIPVYGQS